MKDNKAEEIKALNKVLERIDQQPAIKRDARLKYVTTEKLKKLIKEI